MPDLWAEQKCPFHTCPVCGNYMEWADCWACFGAGGHHDCGEDCCCCLDREEITRDCDECNGEGGYLECSGLPHTDEQMNAYYAAKGVGP
jgi:hypothetical protein